MGRTINLYEAKSHLSALVDAAAAGEEILIAKNGVPKARLTPLPARPRTRKPSSLMTIAHIADDFDATDEATIAAFEAQDIRDGD